MYFVQSTGALANAAESGDRSLPEMALRFDLTVPLARYVAEHEHELTFPFRRYQMQRVYRGERAQRGRFREFYQCDIDVIGKDSLSVRYDAEVLAVIHAVFSELRIGDFSIQLNNRKLMRGFFESTGVAEGERQLAVLREVDKLDKRGADYVRETLVGEGFGIPAEQVEKIRPSWLCVRRAMPMRWRTWPRLKPTPVLRRSCVPVLLNYAKCCSWCRRWVCRKAPIA